MVWEYRENDSKHTGKVDRDFGFDVNLAIRDNVKNLNLYICALLITQAGCQTKTPIFSGDNAFKHLVSNAVLALETWSAGHKNTLNYYLETFKGLADTVFTQSFEDVMPRTGATVKMSNVIAQFNQDLQSRL